MKLNLFGGRGIDSGSGIGERGWGHDVIRGRELRGIDDVIRVDVKTDDRQTVGESGTRGSGNGSQTGSKECSHDKMNYRLP